jgi:glutamate formiminotransferase / 5-formyltetrahydrofolate cyclo-ligase
VSLIECVPNVSEGRRQDVVQALADAITATPGVRLLDFSADPSHHRSVFTFAGEGAALKRAVVALYERALPAIDLREHRGEHPRLGAVDVLPFVPLEGATMGNCVALAREVAAEVAARFDLPVYLYEEAAIRPDRRALEHIRRGQFEGLAARMRQFGWAPDFGPPSPHPTAGASIIGARAPLIAFNVNLATDRLEVARRIAAAVRESSGGLPAVKAMGVSLAERGIVQVSMNLIDFETTPLHVVVERVREEAARCGVEVLESELIGLIPAAAMAAAAGHYLNIREFTIERVLEQRLWGLVRSRGA